MSVVSATKERPILFSGSMVRAIMRDENPKTQTRRVIKPQPVWVGDPNVPFKTQDADPKGIINCPYGTVGDRLWVRETWCRCDDMDGDGSVYYKADGEDIPGPWRPSIHMPRWASRLTLEITEVRVQRLQDISEEDVEAEGIYSISIDAPTPIHIEIRWVAPGVLMTSVHGEKEEDIPCHSSAKSAFECLWDSINSERGYGWDVNPWVWALTFKRVEA